MFLLAASRAIFATLKYSSLTVLDSWRNRLTPTRADEIVRTWATCLLTQARTSVVVDGLSNLVPGETYVVMSNHQSMFDIPVLLVHLPLTLRMVAKAELFQFPVWGHAMLKAGFVPIHRDDRSRSLQDLKLAQSALRSGISIWIAPEGTRSPDGQLLEFKRGGFHLASAVHARILPVTLDGSRRVLAAHSLTIVHDQTVRLTIGAPIDPRSFGKERGRLVETVRAAIGIPLGSGSAAPESASTTTPA